MGQHSVHNTTTVHFMTGNPFSVTTSGCQLETSTTTTNSTAGLHVDRHASCLTASQLLSALQTYTKNARVRTGLSVLLIFTAIKFHDGFHSRNKKTQTYSMYELAIWANGAGRDDWVMSQLVQWATQSLLRATYSSNEMENRLLC